MNAVAFWLTAAGVVAALLVGAVLAVEILVSVERRVAGFIVVPARSLDPAD